MGLNKKYLPPITLTRIVQQRGQEGQFLKKKKGINI